TRRIYSWTIADAHTNESIGRILLSDFQNNNTAANIGFFIKRKYWGKGIATACVAAVIKFGFEYMHLERI
ncbi:MAG: GNAT family N-acetyltransferase, partial [Ruminococcus sp.]|nr:GNAT family N-acetyltransferase [Ruminococcus sp.]